MSSEEACCSRPPVRTQYTPRGRYTTLAGLKCYAVSPPVGVQAKAAILYIYDIHGFFPQTLCGADRLANAGFAVFMPDLLLGNGADFAMFDGSSESEKRKEAFWAGFPARVETQSEPVSRCAEEIKAKGYEKIMALGACWGFKVVVQSRGLPLFDAIASNHPSFGSRVEDGDKIDVPLLLQPSMDEDMEVMQGIVDRVNLRYPGMARLRRFGDCIHGWTSARADLDSGKGRRDFDEAYQGIIEFFTACL